MVLRLQNILVIFLALCFRFSAWTSTRDGSPVVTSTVRMNVLATFERRLVSFIRRTPSLYPPEFVNFVSSIEDERLTVYNASLSFIDFPINQYRLIRRFGYEWALWLELMSAPNKSKIHIKISPSSASQFLSFYRRESLKHDEVDQFEPWFNFQAAANAMSRLQVLHQNKSGLLFKEEANGCHPLSELELLELAAATFDEESNYDYAFHWMSLFVERMRKHLPYSSEKFMVDYVIKHRDTYMGPVPHHHFLNVEKGAEVIKRVIDLMEEFPEQSQRYFDLDEETQICRLNNDLYKAGHDYCFLFHPPDLPYFTFKYEMLNINPYVAVIHNFIPLQKAREFISTGINLGSEINEISDSEFAEKDTYSTNMNIRLSETTFMDPRHPLSLWLDYRVEHATLLPPHSLPVRYGVLDGEEIHIQHYGLSGHYAAHHDYFDDSSPDDRLATVLVYLSDVHSGGHTAFPDLRISLTPRAGTALVWFNLDPLNGSTIPLTLHTGCPVNVGRKWMINRWISRHQKIGHIIPVYK